MTAEGGMVDVLIRLTLFFLLLSCSMSSSPDYDGSGESLEKNRIKIIDNSNIVRINESEMSWTGERRAALVTFHNAGTGDVERVVPVREGIAERVAPLPEGSYRLSAEFLDGRSIPPPPRMVNVENGTFESVQLASEQMTGDTFYYKWESDGEGYESEYSINDDVVRKVTVMGEEIDTHNNSAARTLEQDYNIILSDDGVPWNYALASRLLREVASLPHKKLENPVSFLLSSEDTFVPIAITQKNSHTTVVLNFKVFSDSSKKLVKLGDRRGRFFSLELFKALVSFFTDEGRNRTAVEKILEDKFAVTTRIPDIRYLTGEHPDNFQSFHPEELLHLIGAFAEMPRGYHKIAGLRYLLRRRNGHPHPLYPSAAAVAWPKGADTDSYIEFMDMAFISGSRDSIHRLILHEKSHFLWKNIFSQNLREQWIELGGWFPNEEVSSGWSTRDNVGFVSPYAHDINPNEDMAESLSHYVLNPEKLLATAPKKFQFIEQNIMNGYQYVSQIREDLTFEVLNLFPDYDFPGKIRTVEVTAEGGPEQDKKVSVVVELTDKKGIQDSAVRAFSRVHSPQKTFVDVHLYPVNGNGHKLKGTFTVPKSAKKGYWKVENIHITDQAGNERYEGAVDFGFKLYINNGKEDTTPPRYVSQSMNIEVDKDTRNGHQTFNFDITWKVEENQDMKIRYPVYARLVSLDYRERHHIEGYGDYDAKKSRARVRLTLTGYHPPGRYGVVYVGMQDKALNRGEQYFSDDPGHEAIVQVKIDPKNPDFERPVLDVDRIGVVANPQNAEAPDGSTVVHINFYAKDDKSGLGPVTYRLKDPLGRTHFNYFTHSDTHTLFFSAGEPDHYRHYRIEALLPKGSPPGRWGVMEIVLTDKSGNSNTYNFVKNHAF